MFHGLTADRLIADCYFFYTGNMTETAFLGGGCFWCLEAVFDRVSGVKSVESGYMGGHVDNPAYRQVCAGTTGHVEIVRVIFRSEERRVGKECRSRWSSYHRRKKTNGS